MVMLYILLVLITLENCCHAAPFNKTIPDSNKLKLELFYSPKHSGSNTLIQKAIIPVMSTDLRPYVQLRMCPIVNNCTLRNLFSPRCKRKPGEVNIEHMCIGKLQDFSDDDRLVPIMKYGACLFDEKYLYTLPGEEIISNCRKRSTLTKWEREFIDECFNEIENPTEYNEEPFMRYAKYNPGYYPFFVVNDTQSTKQDSEGFKNLIKMLCNKLKSKPRSCNDPTTLSRDIDVGDVTTKDREDDDASVVEEPSLNPSPNQSYSLRPRFLLMALINLILFLLIHKISL